MSPHGPAPPATPTAGWGTCRRSSSVRLGGPDRVTKGFPRPQRGRKTVIPVGPTVCADPGGAGSPDRSWHARGAAAGRPRGRAGEFGGTVRTRSTAAAGRRGVAGDPAVDAGAARHRAAGRGRRGGPRSAGRDPDQHARRGGRRGRDEPAVAAGDPPLERARAPVLGRQPVPV